MEQQHREHHACIDTFKQLAERMGHECVMKPEEDIGFDDMDNVECVVALGGDHTFLRA